MCAMRLNTQEYNKCFNGRVTKRAKMMNFSKTAIVFNIVSFRFKKFHKEICLLLGNVINKT